MQNKFANYIGKFKKIKNWILIVIFSILSFGFLVGTSQTENRIHSNVIQQKLLSSMVLEQSGLKQEFTSHVDRQTLTMSTHDLREDSPNNDHVLANKRNNNKPWKVFGENPNTKNYWTRLKSKDNNKLYFINPKKRVVRNVEAQLAATADIDSIKAILNAKDGDDLIIVLSNDSTGNIIANNKDAIEKKLRKMITDDDIGAANHDSMKGVTISVSMPTDSQITTTTKEITVTLSKGDGTLVETNAKFQVRRELTSIEKNNADIDSIKAILNAKDGDDLIIVLSNDSTGNIIANNKDAIEKKLRKMITDDDIGAANHDSMKGVTISVSMPTDSQITTTAQEFTIELTKSDGTPVQINKFKVKRDWTIAEKAANTSIDSIKQQLDKLVGNALIIVLPSDTTGNIIADNKDKITKELRKMITGDDIGAANHDSMKGVTISVSMPTDSQITTTTKEITVTLSKGDGTPITINNFKVKKELTTVVTTKQPEVKTEDASTNNIKVEFKFTPLLDDEDRKSKLQYKKSSDITWIDISDNKVENIDPGEYNLRWTLIDPSPENKESEKHHDLDDFTIERVILNPPSATIESKVPYKGAKSVIISIEFPVSYKGEITYQMKDTKYTWSDKYSELQYSSDETTWTIFNKDKITVDNKPYYTKWVAKPYNKYSGDKTETQSTKITVTTESKIQVPTKIPNIVVTSPTAKGLNDGSFKVRSNADNTYSQLQYHTGTEWKDLINDQTVNNLAPGKYQLRWVPKKDTDTYWSSEGMPSDAKAKKLSDIEIPSSDFIELPDTTNVEKTITQVTLRGKEDGTITFNFQEGGKNYQLQKLQKEVTSTTRTWQDVLKADWETVLKDSSTTKTKWKNVDATFTLDTIGTRLVNKYSKLQYKNLRGEWVDVVIGKIITGLKTGTYELKWVSKNGEKYKDTSSQEKKWGTFSILDTDIIPDPPKITTVIKKPSHKDAKDGVITFTKWKNDYSKLQYSSDGETTWKDLTASTLGFKNQITKVEAQDYSIRWVPKESGNQYSGGETIKALPKITVTTEPKIQVPTQTPTIAVTSPTAKGLNDGQFQVTPNADDTNSKLQYHTGTEWKDLPNDQTVKNLAPGKYQLRWVPKKTTDTYLSSEGVSLDAKAKKLSDIEILSSKFIDIPEAITRQIKELSNIGAEDAAITFDVPLDRKNTQWQEWLDNKNVWKDVTFTTDAEKTNALSNNDKIQWIDKYSKLQYKKESDSKWVDVKENKIIDLKEGTYNLRWISIKGEKYKGVAKVIKPLDDFVIKSTIIPNPPKATIEVIKQPSHKDAADGVIAFKLADDRKYTKIQKLQKKTISSTWVDVKNIDELISTKTQWVDLDTSQTTAPAGIKTRIVDKYSKLQYKKEGKWEDIVDYKIQKVKSGNTYQWRWVPIDDKMTYSGDKKFLKINFFSISTIKIISVPKNPVVETQKPSVRGKSDGKFEITEGGDANDYYKLQYKNEKDSKWEDIPEDLKVINLKVGKFQLRWKIKKDEYTFVGPEKPTFSLIKPDITIHKAEFIPVPQDPTITSTQTTAKGLSDGQITITLKKDSPNTSKQYSDDGGISWHDISKLSKSIHLVENKYLFRQTNIYSKLQYQKVGDTDWKDVDGNKLVGLQKGNYKFKWKSKNVDKYVGTTSDTHPITKEANVGEAKKVLVPSKNPEWEITRPLIKGEVGKIKPTEQYLDHYSNESTNKLIKYSVLQAKHESQDKWADLSPGLITTLKAGEVEFRWKVKEEGDTYLISGKDFVKLPSVTILPAKRIKLPTTTLTYRAKSPSTKGKSDGQFTIIAATKDTHKYSKLQYQNSGSWIDIVENKVLNLKADEYRLRWVPEKADLSYETTDDSIIKQHPIEKVIIPQSKKIIIPPTPQFRVSPVSTKDNNDGFFEILSSYKTNYSQLYYRKKEQDTWIKIETNKIIGLVAGDYELQWQIQQSEQGETYLRIDKNFHTLKDVLSIGTPQKLANPQKPTIIIHTNIQVQDGSEGVIQITSEIDKDSNLEYRIDGTTTWKNVETKQIANLKAGKYHFRLTPKNPGNKYIGGNKYINLQSLTLDDGFKVKEPEDLKDLVFESTDASAKNGQNGKITIKGKIKDDYSLLQYKHKEDNSLSWKNVEKNILTNLKRGNYLFRWVPIVKDTYYKNDAVSIDEGEVVVGAKNELLFPTKNPRFIISNANPGKNDGIIELAKGWRNLYSTLAFSKDKGKNWKRIQKVKFENLAPGEYWFRWITKEANEKYLDTKTSNSNINMVVNISVKEKKHPIFFYESNLSILFGSVLGFSVLVVFTANIVYISRRKKRLLKKQG